MTATKAKIIQAIQAQIESYQEWANRCQAQLQAAAENGMTGCVFVQQVSARKYHVGWRFTPQGTHVGDTQQDSHVSYNRNQEIVWVAE